MTFPIFGHFDPQKWQSFNLIPSKLYVVDNKNFHLVSLYILLFFELGSKEQLLEPRKTQLTFAVKIPRWAADEHTG